MSARHPFPLAGFLVGLWWANPPQISFVWSMKQRWSIGIVRWSFFSIILSLFFKFSPLEKLLITSPYIFRRILWNDVSRARKPEYHNSDFISNFYVAKSLTPSLLKQYCSVRHFFQDESEICLEMKVKSCIQNNNEAHERLTKNSLLTLGQFIWIALSLINLRTHSAFFFFNFFNNGN